MHVTQSALVELERTAFQCLSELEKRKLHSTDSRLRTLSAIGNRVMLSKFSKNTHMIQLLANAFGDAGYIALGARNKILPRTEDPAKIADAISRSKGKLLILADLNDRGINDLKDYWRYIWPTEQHLPTGTLDLATEPEISVSFNHTSLIDLDSFIVANAGCPVRGAVLNRFFDRYVETVIGE